MRIRFKKGKQRAFLKEVLIAIGSPSLRELINRGFDIPYSTLKNYYSESRLLPEGFFRELVYLAKINVNELDIDVIKDNWGKVLGGSKKRNV